MAFVRILTALLRHKEIGPRVVPIVPDESRTFGMEGLFRQVGIFSQESVAWMDGVGARLPCGVDQRALVEIAVARGRFTDTDSLVCLAHVERVLVGRRVDGDRRDAQLAARADHTKSDLAAVGDQDLLEERLRHIRLWPFSQ